MPRVQCGSHDDGDSGSALHLRGEPLTVGGLASERREAKPIQGRHGHQSAEPGMSTRSLTILGPNLQPDYGERPR